MLQRGLVGKAHGPARAEKHVVVEVGRVDWQRRRQSEGTVVDEPGGVEAERGARHGQDRSGEPGLHDAALVGEVQQY